MFFISFLPSFLCDEDYLCSAFSPLLCNDVLLTPILLKNHNNRVCVEKTGHIRSANPK